MLQKFCVIVVILSLALSMTSTVVSAETYGDSKVVNDSDDELYTTTDSPWSTQQGATVTYEQTEIDAEVTVIIPKSITIGSDRTADYDIIVKGYAEECVEVRVEPHDDIDDVEGNNFILSPTNILKSDVVATVTQEDTVWSAADITEMGTSKSGSISAADLTRGHWSGVLTFDINMIDTTSNE